MSAQGNRFGVEYQSGVDLPKPMPDFTKIGQALSAALAAIVEARLRLRVNMIPQPLFGHNLRKYLPKAGWLQLRKDLISQRGCRCELCGTSIGTESEVDAHEEWEYDAKKRPARATVTGIKLACAQCHAVVHFGLQISLVQQGKLPPSHLDVLKRHFCRVNQVGPSTFDVHFDAAFERWKLLNQRTAWHLDFGRYQHFLESRAA